MHPAPERDLVHGRWLEIPAAERDEVDMRAEVRYTGAVWHTPVVLPGCDKSSARQRMSPNSDIFPGKTHHSEQAGSLLTVTAV